MLFQLRRNDFPKLDVLETKFNMYEDLSRQMIDKLEQAVEKISDSNNKIASILSKHDERIERTLKNDEGFAKQIDELKKENKEEHSMVIARVEKLELKIDDLTKFRWILGGIGIICMVLITSMITLAAGWLSPLDRNIQTYPNAGKINEEIKK